MRSLQSRRDLGKRLQHSSRVFCQTLKAKNVLLMQYWLKKWLIKSSWLAKSNSSSISTEISLSSKKH